MNSFNDEKPVVVHVRYGVWPWLIGMVAGASLTVLYYEWAGAMIENAVAQSKIEREKDALVQSIPNCEELGKLAQQEAEKIRLKEEPLREAERARRMDEEKDRPDAVEKKQAEAHTKSKEAVDNGNFHALSTDELIGHVRTERGPKFDEIKEELHQRAEHGDARAAAVYSFLTDTEWGTRLPNMSDPTLKKADKKEYHLWSEEKLWQKAQMATGKELEWIKQELLSRAEQNGDIKAKNMYEAICIFHGIDNTPDEKPAPRIRRVMPEPVVCLTEMPPDFYDNWSTERICLIIRSTRPGAKDFQPMLNELKKRAKKGESAAQEVVDQMIKRGF